MAAKGKIIADTFEQVGEIGVSTVKKGAKQISETAALQSVLRKLGEKPPVVENGKKKNHTPLDLDALNKKHESKQQDSGELSALRNRLFQMVKEGEEKELQRKKREQQEKEARENREEEDKKKKEEEKKKMQSQGEPRGKTSRRGVFSIKKAVQRERTEIRPSTGKQ